MEESDRDISEIDLSYYEEEVEVNAYIFYQTHQNCEQGSMCSWNHR